MIKEINLTLEDIRIVDTGIIDRELVFIQFQHNGERFDAHYFVRDSMMKNLDDPKLMPGIQDVSKKMIWKYEKLVAEFIKLELKEFLQPRYPDIFDEDWQDPNVDADDWVDLTEEYEPQ